MLYFIIDIFCSSCISIGEMKDNYYCGGCICCLSEKKRFAIAKKKEINLIYLEQKRREETEFKFLLLGTAESGKTTFMKQMKIINGSGYSEEERRSYTTLVFQNVFQAMSAMTDAMKTLKIPYSNPQNEIYAQWFQDLDIHQITQLKGSYVEAIRHLWADKGFKICYRRRREYQLLDSTKYFIDSLDRIAAEGYIPTPQDVLQVRFPTTGITDHCFTLEKMTLRFVDVGGQRGLRRKWIHCFENVTSLLFLASLSEYDRSLEENNKENRMEESLSLFYNTIHSQWFANSFIILFLNKMDILAEKIQFSDLKTYYPEFEGKRRDVGDALQFIAQLYEKKAVSNKTKNYRMIYSHFICATDTKNIWRVFNDVKYTILIRDLGTYRML
uniref:Guanine nucleotide binding protein (G protein), alpha 15 (Gq class), tandem duplicate 4 n=1 Tax=Cyprinus carpio TaxID=7962 RepID=A0A8C1J8M4_CYPCA